MRIKCKLLLSGFCTKIIIKDIGKAGKRLSSLLALIIVLEA